MKKKALPFIICGALLLFLISLAYAAITPSDISYKGKTKADVIYKHSTHDVKDKCAACHPRLFKMKRFTTKFTMDDITAGKYCGKCHDGKISFAVKMCDKCHIPSQKPATTTGCPADCTKCNKCPQGEVK